MASSSMLTMALALFLVLYSTLFSQGGATSSLSQVYYVCSPTNYTANSEFAVNLETLFSRLVAASSTTMYANASAMSTSTSSVEAAYGVFQCRGDVSQADCATCVSVVVDAIKGACPSSMSARHMLDSCLLRYDNSSAFYDDNSTASAEMEYITKWCNDINNTDTAFQEAAKRALENVTESAPLIRGFAVHEEGGSNASGGTIFALAECFGYVSPSECQACLSPIEDAARLCPNSIGAQIHYSSCYYRYETGLFYALPSPSSSPSQSPSPSPSLSSSPLPSSTNSSNKGLIAGGVAIAVFVALMGGLILCVYFYRRKAKRTQGGRNDKNFGPSHKSIMTVFSYDELKAATQNFAEENKLGEGGFGPVYKGKFDRESLEVAIKKLSSASNQGKQEFMNEVNIITSVQHQNLIRLLGCCVKGAEKLLVYEYLPSRSLDLHLFDPPEDNLISLDWATRFGIILGTARGLAYLHHDSQVRIIHRDIKPSNILLANDLTPKIADFGLARFMADNISHVTTRVAGTLGYLAPEYAMHGQLTEKADVFSFGMLTLEVVSGRKNSEPTCPPQKQHLLEWAWMAYKEGRHTELVDEKLGGKFCGEEVVRVVHIALLCTQSHPTLRPTMSHVTQLLASQSNILDKPTAPPFVNPSPFDLISPSTSSTTSTNNSTTTSTSTSSSFPLMSHGHVSDLRSVDTLTQLDENVTYESSTLSHVQAM